MASPPSVLHGPSGSPVLDCRPDKECNLFGRDPRLPTIYESFNHPLNKSPNGRSFYIKQDLSQEAMQKAHNLEKELKAPSGDAEQVSTLGKNLLICLYSY